MKTGYGLIATRPETEKQRMGQKDSLHSLAGCCTRRDNIKMGIREIGWFVRDWINLTLEKD
jgi:hypothetical protein